MISTLYFVVEDSSAEVLAAEVIVVKEPLLDCETDVGIDLEPDAEEPVLGLPEVSRATTGDASENCAPLLQQLICCERSLLLS